MVPFFSFYVSTENKKFGFVKITQPCTLRSLLNELARLIPKLGVKQASSFDRDLIVVSLCVLNEETFFRQMVLLVFLAVVI